MKKLLRFTTILCAAAFLLTAGCSASGVKEASSGSSDKSEISISASRAQSEESSKVLMSSTGESSTDESSEKHMTSEELEQLDVASKKIEEFCKTEEYKNAGTDKKREMALDYLNKLADEGLVIKESIDSYGDNITFRYSSGVMGGIMLREWDPELN